MTAMSTETPRPTETGECRHCGGSIYRYQGGATWWHRSTYLARCRPRRPGADRTEAAPTNTSR